MSFGSLTPRSYPVRHGPQGSWPQHLVRQGVKVRLKENGLRKGETEPGLYVNMDRWIE